ncbi:MAG: histidinol dehydrogenase [Spirochaetota bacterium]
MLPIYRYPDEKVLSQLLSRPGQEQAQLREKVSAIIERVAEQGDAALFSYAKMFDGQKLDRLEISEQEMAEAEALLDESLISAIKQAKQNITAFHQAQKAAREQVETEPGVLCWREARPIETVGIYIPGGTAPLFSTVLMLAVPAAVAGCKEIVLMTPAGKDGKVHPAVLFAARISGVSRCFISGGAQAVAALAYGTESVPKVDKIFGPGNQYVTMAKQLVSLDKAAVDMPAGPSEVLVIADEQADPAFVAADLLSQAEHGADSQVLLVTTSEELADAVYSQVEEQIERLSRRVLAARSLSSSAVIIVRDMKEAFALSNRYAPEHLILQIRDAQAWASQVQNAGSVFLGRWTPESVGDYASGTNHTLPTSGWAVSYSGVSLDSFIKKITFQQLSREGLERVGPAVEVMAAEEGLDAHKQAVSLRLASEPVAEAEQAQRGEAE